MIPILRRQLLRTTVALTVAGTSFGCNANPAPASPTAGTPSGASPAASFKAPPAGPRIVGTVLLSSTGKAPTGGVVYLEDAPRQPGMATTAAIDVDHKDFLPFIAVIATGGTVTFGNKDALTHHVFSPDLPGWDTGYLQKGDTARRTFDAPGPFALLCNIHPEMLGYVLVIPSTIFRKNRRGRQVPHRRRASRHLQGHGVGTADADRIAVRDGGPHGRCHGELRAASGDDELIAGLHQGASSPSPCR